MKKLIIANWKMNPVSLKEAQKMMAGLKAGLKNSKVEVVVCPPFVYLTSFKFQVLSFKLGAQNCFWENRGAFTGEVSVKMLKDTGVKYVILGHSERRIIMGETAGQVNKKIKAVLQSGLVPVVCFGESLEEKQQGKSFVSIEKELKEMLEKISKENVAKIIFAYEPDWAIGTGNNCSSDDALTMALFVKKIMGEVYGKKVKESVRVLYGGSIGADNALSYLENEAISGLLVGGASLNIKKFLDIVENI
ncbi:MAG: triose-phosphate isomerase [Candidatus Pacebacteria bacterium]|nr:triose-phosphate isomerase [Candidatus Paceibacterota bacterium]